MRQRAVSQRLLPRGQIARARDWLFASSMAMLALVAIVAIIVILEVLSGGRAYVHGEGRYTKGQQTAVFYLDRYAEKGRPRDLAAARVALEVPLGDYRARLAMQGDEFDYEAAYRGLLQGQNEPADIPTMIWLFRYFQDAPYAAAAVETWEKADRRVLKLVAIAEELEAQWSEPPVEREEITDVRERITTLDRSLQELEKDFSTTISNGLHALQILVTGVIAIVVVLLAVSSVLVYRWTTRRITRSERKFWAIFEHAPVGVAVISEAGQHVDVNEAYGRILGKSPEAVVGTSIEEFTHRADQEEETSLLNRVRAAPRGTITLERRYGQHANRVVWGKLTLTGVSNAFEGGGAFIGILEDVSEEHQLSEQLSYQATHDPATGLFNRRRFETELTRLLEDVQVEGSCHALGFVDLDRFKVVNDTCGHQAGDTLLYQLAHIMRKTLRSSDIFARLGGDEFGFILRDCDVTAARQIADTLRREVDAFTFAWEERSFSLSCSIGIVMVDQAATNSSWLLQRADSACYVAKEEGGGRVRLHSKI